MTLCTILQRASLFTILAALSVAMLSACEPAVDNAPLDRQIAADMQTIAAPAVSMRLSQLKSGGWQLDLDLPEAETAGERVLFFSRSEGDYRQSRFEALDAAMLDRIGGFDTLVFPPGVTQARFLITPTPVTISGTYDPFIDFADGGQAIYLGAFELLPADSTASVAALAGQISRWQGQPQALPFTLRTQDPLILDGKLYPNKTVDFTLSSSAAYAYAGPGNIRRGDSFVGVVDTGLPDWIAARFDDDLAQLFAFYEEAFGYALPQPATLLFAFGGAEEPGLSNTGGVLSGQQIVLDVSGSLLSTPEPRINGYLQWFFAHEAAHLFQGATTLEGYSDPAHSWIGEGGANAMVDTAFARKQMISEDVRQSRMVQAYQGCVAAIEGADMNRLVRRNDQSHYDCGQVLWWIADAATPDTDVFTLWTALVEVAAKSTPDKADTYDADMFLSVLSDAGAKARVVDGIQDVLSGPNMDPETDLLALMSMVGLKIERREGLITAIAYPARP